MGNPDDIERRTEFERQQFALYETRRLEVEKQATAVIAAALAIAAFTLNDFGRAGHPALGWLLVAVVGLLITSAYAFAARSLDFRTPRWRLGSKWDSEASEHDDKTPELPHQATKRTLACVRELPVAETDPLKTAILAHWYARAQSAWQLGELKDKRLRWSLWGFVGPVVYIVVRIICS